MKTERRTEYTWYKGRKAKIITRLPFGILLIQLLSEREELQFALQEAVGKLDKSGWSLPPEIDKEEK